MAKVARVGQQVIDALVNANMITDPSSVARVLIDIPGDGVPMVYVQRYVHSDDGLASVIDALAADFNPGQLVDSSSSDGPLAPTQGGE